MRTPVLGALAAVIALSGVAACGSEPATIPDTKGAATAEAAADRAQDTTAGLDAAGVAKALAEAGLPARLSVTFDESTDPNKLLGRPGGYTSKAAFVDSRVDAPWAEKGDVLLGGSVEVFPTSEAAQRRAEYVKTLAESSPIFAEYTYVQGPVVLRVSKELAPKDAAEYEAALGKIVK